MVELYCDGRKFLVPILYADMYELAVSVEGVGKLSLRRAHKNDCYSAKIDNVSVYVDGGVMS